MIKMAWFLGGDCDVAEWRAFGRTTKPRRFWLSLAYRKPTPGLAEFTWHVALTSRPLIVDLDL